MNDTFLDLVDSIDQALADNRLRELHSDRQAQAALIAQSICERIGGMLIYLPSKRGLEGKLARQEREQLMRCEFSGKNLAALAKKYRLSERHERRIVCPPPPQHKK